MVWICSTHCKIKKMLHIFHLENSSKTMWRFGHRWENNIKAYHRTKNHIKVKARLTKISIRPVKNFCKCSKVFKNFTNTLVSTHQGRTCIIKSLISFCYISQLVSEWVSEWVIEGVSQFISQSVTLSVNLAFSQSVNWSDRAPATQMPIY